jgi:hypothetical protein
MPMIVSPGAVLLLLFPVYLSFADCEPVSHTQPPARMGETPQREMIGSFVTRDGNDTRTMFVSLDLRRATP